jgi:hypothetical protein
VLLDNFANSDPAVMERLQRITGRPLAWNGAMCWTRPG